MIRLAAIIAFMLVPMTAALAHDFPRGECRLRDDASRVLILASNPGATSYTCVASCRADVTGQRAL
jgi:hypothetical protein